MLASITYNPWKRSPWNTLGISNEIKHVFLMWIKMFNIGYKKKTGTSTKLFPSPPPPHHSMLRHFGDMLNTFAHLNTARGNEGAIFPKRCLNISRNFSRIVVQVIPTSACITPTPFFFLMEIFQYSMSLNEIYVEY